MAKRFEDMNEEEKRQKFEQWVASRTVRRGESKLRRVAIQALIKAHQPEYDALLTKAGAKPRKAA